MKVSIIVPIYSVAPYIERCLISIINQTYTDIEIILVNDCTPDNSMDIVASFLENVSPNILIRICNHIENQGLSEARNTGIREATGDYLYFLDSDDELPLNSIENLASLAKKDHSNFVIGGIQIEGDYPEVVLPFEDCSCILGNKEIRGAFFKQKWYVMACNKLINRDFLLKNELFFYKGIYHEDLLWSFELALVAKSMSICLQKTYIYYIRGNSISTTVSRKNIEDRVYIYNILVARINDDELLEEDPNFLDFLESIRFGILSICKDKELWLEVKAKMIEVKDTSIASFFNANMSIGTRVKRLLHILPTSISFFIFIIYGKLRQ